MSESSFVPTAQTADAFRKALGCFATGVTVVTALSENAPLAITVNSFSSVSLDPPLILWCPARLSPRHDAFVSAESFTVHVMAENQQDLALRFARDGADFGGVDWTISENQAPELAGCLARFECRRWAVNDGGDHSIVIGEVLRATHRPGKGLVFKRGQFGGFLGVE